MSRLGPYRKATASAGVICSLVSTSDRRSWSSLSTFGCLIEYKDDHYKHRSDGDRENPPTWVIPPGRRVNIQLGKERSPASLNFVVPSGLSFTDQGLRARAIKEFRELSNNPPGPVDEMGGLGPGSLTSTATFGAARAGLHQQVSLPPVKIGSQGCHAWVMGKKIGEGSFGQVFEVFNSAD